MPGVPLPTLIPDQSDDHGVEIEEEHEEVEAKLDEGFLLVDVEFAEDFGGVEEVLILEDSARWLVNNATDDSMLLHPMFLGPKLTSSRSKPPTASSAVAAASIR